MSNQINNGGTPSFVHTEPPKGTQLVFNQVELRDYFAAAALKGFCASLSWNPTESVHFANLAEDAYQAADAMLRAREGKP